MEDVSSFLGDLLPDIVTEAAEAVVTSQGIGESVSTKPIKQTAKKAAAGDKGGDAIKKTRKKRRLVKSQPTTVDEWLDSRILEPSLFSMTSEGNFKVPEINPGDRETVLDCPQYYSASSASIREFMASRQEKLKEAKQQYAESRRFLLSMHKQYKANQASLADVLTANKQVTEAEQFLITAAYAERSTRIAMPPPLLKNILAEANNVYALDGIKMPYSVIQVDRTFIPWSTFFTKTPPAEQPQDSLPEVTGPAPAPEPSTNDQDRDRTGARTRAIIASRRIKKASTAAY